jgi:hypothetical protein
VNSRAPRSAWRHGFWPYRARAPVPGRL